MLTSFLCLKLVLFVCSKSVGLRNNLSEIRSLFLNILLRAFQFLFLFPVRGRAAFQALEKKKNKTSVELRMFYNRGSKKCLYIVHFVRSYHAIVTYVKTV